MTTTQSRNKKTAAGAGIAAAAAAVLAIGAGTYAGFFDTEDGPDTTVAAGTLFIGDFDSTEIDPVGNLAPGDTATRTLSYTNGGSLPGTFDITFSLDADLENGCAGGSGGPEDDAEGGTGDCGPTGELDDQSSVVVDASVDGGTTSSPAFSGSVADLVATGFEFDVDDGDTVTFTITFTFDDIPADTTNPHGNNAAQGDSFTLGSTATLNQQTP